MFTPVREEAQRELESGEVEITDKQRQAFLDYIREHPQASAREACAAVRIRRKHVRALRRMDADFDADYFEARGLTADSILAEVKRRAIDGVDEPVFHNGLVVGEIRRYSDRLLLALARSFVPEMREAAVRAPEPWKGELEVKVDHDFGALLQKLERFGLVRAGGSAGPADAVDAAPLALLPASADRAADGRAGGAPVSP